MEKLALSSSSKDTAPIERLFQKLGESELDFTIRVAYGYGSTPSSFSLLSLAEKSGLGFESVKLHNPRRPEGPLTHAQIKQFNAQPRTPRERKAMRSRINDERDLAVSLLKGVKSVLMIIGHSEAEIELMNASREEGQPAPRWLTPWEERLSDEAANRKLPLTVLDRFGKTLFARRPEDYRELDEQIAVMEDLKRTFRVGRNDPCPCQSGKKFKKCCGAGLTTTDFEAEQPAEIAVPE